MTRFFNTAGMDICIRWPLAGEVHRYAMELKVWRSGRPDPQDKGLDQLAGYLERLGLDCGTLVIFDQRDTAPPLPGRTSANAVKHGTHEIQVLRL